MSLFTGALALAAVVGAATATTAAAKINSGASESNAATQANAAQQALDFTKAQKAKQEAAYAPFQSISQQALGAPPPQRIVPNAPPAPYSSQPNATMPMGQPSGPTYGGGGGSTLMGMSQPQAAPMPTAQLPQAPGAPQAQAADGPLVLLQAPDGSQKRVPASMAPAYIARGAKQIG